MGGTSSISSGATMNHLEKDHKSLKNWNPQHFPEFYGQYWSISIYQLSSFLM